MNEELEETRKQFIDDYIDNNFIFLDYIRHHIVMSFLCPEIELPEERLAILYD